jgi:hypothetical protein
MPNATRFHNGILEYSPDGITWIHTTIGGFNLGFLLVGLNSDVRENMKRHTLNQQFEPDHGYEHWCPRCNGCSYFSCNVHPVCSC